MPGHRVHALLASAGAGLPVKGYITYKISFKLATHNRVHVQVAPKLQIQIEIHVHPHCFDNPKTNYRSTKRNNDFRDFSSSPNLFSEFPFSKHSFRYTCTCAYTRVAYTLVQAQTRHDVGLDCDSKVYQQTAQHVAGKERDTMRD